VKILLVTSDYLPNVSGVATLTHEQAAGLAEFGHEVRILTTTVGRMRQEQGYGTYVTRIAPPANSLARVHFLKRELIKEGSRWRPDFIWCTTYRGFGVPAMWAAHRLDVPYGVYFHGTELQTENRFLRRNVLRCVAGRSRVVATNSRNSQKLLSDSYGIRSKVITPGVHRAPMVDPEARAALRRHWLKELQANVLEGDAFICICACRISRAKGIDKAIEAITKLPESLQVRCIYVIAGEGPDKEYLTKLSRSVRLEKQIYFSGPVDRLELPKYLAAADCYLQPSQPIDGFLESFGISFLEAQMAGLPCIATRFGGIPEAIKSDETGILVEPGSVSELQEAMIRVMSSTEWYRNAKCAAKEWADANLWSSHIYKLNILIASD